MAEEVMGAFLKAVEKGERVALATVIRAVEDAPAKLGSKLLVWFDGKTLGNLGDPYLQSEVIQDCLKAMDSGRSVSLGYPRSEGLERKEPQTEVFIEVAEVEPALLIIGAGHIAQPLSRLGKMLGFEVTVLDDRPDFANTSRFPEADHVVAADFAETLSSFPITGISYIILVTRGHKHDEACLRQVIHSPAAYIGMIGSRRRVKAVFMHLDRDGFSSESLRRVHAPIGLDIGAETPEEIALSIMAEVVKVRRGGTGRSMSEKELRSV